MSEAETQNLSKIYGNARNNALSALTQGVKSATSTLKQQASYDITEAFNNYKQQQLALKASTFGTGSKDYLTNKNARAFDTTSMATAGSFENQYNNLVGNALSNASSVNQSYSDNMAKGVAQIATDYAKREEALNKVFAEQGAIMDKIDNKILEYATAMGISYDKDKLYKFVRDKDNRISHRELTNTGKSLYKQIIEGDNDGVYFRDYGIEQGWFTDEEYDQYITSMIGGYDYDNAYTYTYNSDRNTNIVKYTEDNDTYISHSDTTGSVKTNNTSYNYSIISKNVLNNNDLLKFIDDNMYKLNTTYKYYPVGTYIPMNTVSDLKFENLNKTYETEIRKYLEDYGLIVTDDGLKLVHISKPEVIGRSVKPTSSSPSSASRNKLD